MMENKFLGRTLNPNTLMWEYEDKSGYPCPEEMRQEVLLAMERRHKGPDGYYNGVAVLGTLFQWQEKMKNLPKTPSIMNKNMPDTTNDWENVKKDIEFLKHILPYWEADDKDDYMYVVHHYDLERVAKKMREYFKSSLREMVEGIPKVEVVKPLHGVGYSFGYATESGSTNITLDVDAVKAKGVLDFMNRYRDDITKKAGLNEK